MRGNGERAAVLAQWLTNGFMTLWPRQQPQAHLAPHPEEPAHACGASLSHVWANRQRGGV